MRTTNGGDDWTTQDTGVPATLLALDVVPGSSIAWAAGGFGAIIYTNNASTWSTQSTPTVVPLLGLRLSNQEGYAVGVGGLVLYTESAGNPP